MPSDPSASSLSARLATLSPALPGGLLAVAVAAAGMVLAHLLGGPGLLYVLILGLLLGPLAHARLGADIDQRIGRNGVLSLSAHKAVGNAGGNPFSVSASLHFGF